MRFAVLTDIHANREAYEAVLADAAMPEIDRIAILGDIVGYGPDPEWCCDKTKDLVAEGAVCLRGNHDSAASGVAESMNGMAQRAMDWTKNRLNAEQRRFLGQLPMTTELDDILLVHASANDPGAWSYVTSDLRATGSFRASRSRIILCGHVHVPMLVSCDRGGTVREQQGQPCASCRHGRGSKSPGL